MWAYPSCWTTAARLSWEWAPVPTAAHKHTGEGTSHNSRKADGCYLLQLQGEDTICYIISSTKWKWGPLFQNLLGISRRPWPVRLSWLGFVPQSERSPVPFPVGLLTGCRLAWSKTGHIWGNWSLFLSHLNISFPFFLPPFPLSENKLVKS